MPRWRSSRRPSATTRRATGGTATCGATSTRAPRASRARRAGPRRARGHLRRARRAAVGVSARLADGGVKPGDVVILLGRHSIEAAVAMLGCLHRGVVLAPLPPMFNQTQIAALVEQTRRDGDRDLRRREGDRQVPRGRGRGRRSLLDRRRPSTSTRCRARTSPADAHGAPRRRPGDGPALLRHDVGAEGHRALEQHDALRDRGRVPALGAHRRGHLPGRGASSASSAACLRLLAGAAQGRDRRAGQPLGPRGRAAADRGAPLHLRAAMPTHAADMIARRRADRRATSPRCACWPRPGLTRERRAGDAGGLRASRRSATTGSPRSRATPRTASTSPTRRSSAPRVARTTAPRSGSSTNDERAGAGRHGRHGDRQRPEPLPRVPQQRRADARRR